MRWKWQQTWQQKTECDCVIRKPGFPTGLLGGDQRSHRDLLAQSLGRTASRLQDTLRQMSYVLQSYRACSHGFSSHPSYSVASEPRWVCHESVPNSLSLGNTSVLCHNWDMHRHFDKVHLLFMEDTFCFICTYTRFHSHSGFWDLSLVHFFYIHGSWLHPWCFLIISLLFSVICYLVLWCVNRCKIKRRTSKRIILKGNDFK